MPRTIAAPLFFALMLSCSAKDNLFAESEPMQTDSNSATGTPEKGDCGEDEGILNGHCYVLHYIDTITAPNAVLGADFADSSTEQFAVFTTGSSASLVKTEGETIAIQSEVPPLNLGTYSQVTALNILGSTAPDIAHTSIWTAGTLPNQDGTFQALVPLELPEEAFVEPGLTIPIDLDNDHKMDYIKGSGARVDIWRNDLDQWKKTATEFLVPGCQVLVDFAHGDFNADGRVDIAYIGSADMDSGSEACGDPAVHGIAILLQTEVGGLTMTPLVTTAQHKYLKVAVGDFDGDKSEDLAALTLEEDLLLFRSAGNGHFESPRIVDDILAFTIGNVDNEETSEIAVFTRTRQAVILKDPFTDLKSMTFQKMKGVPLAVGDLNLDGRGDIAFLLDGVPVPILAIAVSKP